MSVRFKVGDVVRFRADAWAGSDLPADYEATFGGGRTYRITAIYGASPAESLLLGSFYCELCALDPPPYGYHNDPPLRVYDTRLEHARAPEEGYL